MASAFERRVYSAVSRIPRGRVSTYSEVARVIGKPCAARTVGNALSANRDLKRVPCYRVVRSDGAVGGYAKGSAKKIALLRADGIEIRNGKIACLGRFLFRLGR